VEKKMGCMLHAGCWEIFFAFLFPVWFFGFLPGMFTRSPEQRAWYEQFRGEKKNGVKNPRYVPIAPPSMLYGIVWFILYTAMAVAGYLVRHEGGYYVEDGNRWPLITFWILQGVLFFFTLLFFSWKQRVLGAIDVFVGLVLTIVVGVLFIEFSWWAAALMFVTAVWEAFALILAIWIIAKNTSSHKRAARSILQRLAPKSKGDEESSVESNADKSRPKRSMSVNGVREK
jgi:tryptophan-rich sensory protein